LCKLYLEFSGGARLRMDPMEVRERDIAGYAGLTHSSARVAEWLMKRPASRAAARAPESAAPGQGASHADKDVAEVVEVCEAARVTRRVAGLEPFW
jgi:RNA-splicing ligase RtcB